MAYIIPNDDDTYTLRIGATNGVVANQNLAHLFEKFISLKEISDLDNFDTSSTTNMSYLFHDDRKLSTVDIDHLEIEKVPIKKYIFDAYHLFYNNSEFTECGEIECSISELFERLRM